VSPRASRDRIAGWDGQTLKVSLTAPPVDDQANRSLVRLLAKSLDLPQGALSIERGGASRLKTVAVSSLEPEELASRLDALAKGS
jgi:uncharacterized protein (TIGR00251 family)